MGKGILKVTVLECGRKCKDRTSKEYEIDFAVSNTESVGFVKGDHGIPSSFYPGTQLKAEVLATGKVEIL